MSSLKAWVLRFWVVVAMDKFAGSRMLNNQFVLSESRFGTSMDYYENHRNFDIKRILGATPGIR
jgi:hypothetical protein